jgi:hypothetical protein
MFIDFAITGSNPKIFGYKFIGEMVPDVKITEGKDFHIGFILSEQSKHDNVSNGSAMFPSIG